MRTLRQDSLSIPLLRLLNLAPGSHAGGHLDRPAGDKEPSETANPITECDQVRSYAAPDPLGTLGLSFLRRSESLPSVAICAQRSGLRVGRCLVPSEPRELLSCISLLLRRYGGGRGPVTPQRPLATPDATR